MNSEGSSLVEYTTELYISLKQFHDVADYRQSQPGATLAAGSGFIHYVKSLKDPALLMRRYTNARIFELNRDKLFLSYSQYT